MWRLRRIETGEEFGPVDFSSLVQWAHGAQISPYDEVMNEENGQWTPASSVDEFEMYFEVTLDSGQTYGPTNAYMLQEFLRNKEIRLTNLVKDLRTNQEYNVATVALNPAEASTLASVSFRRWTPAPAAATVATPISEMIRQQNQPLTAVTGLGQTADYSKPRIEEPAAAVGGDGMAARVATLEAELKRLKAKYDDLTELYNQIQRQITSHIRAQG